ncbi:baseplate J/gp47 family protein [Streptomyces sp. NPDC001652]|uniref:baseplate J/gp47 family protein n=1 Tax=Streptomyces sp. NPDC001652 TaxID=3154393 RepID=UPI00331B8F4C
MTRACACGCCTGIEVRTPCPVANRPGLPAVGYRVGTHPDFLAAMVAGLTHPDRPRLARLTTRARDDFTVALLDAWAVVADVLTFYSERLIQESYLRTAHERISLQELGALTGFRLAPGAAARTLLAFALQPPAQPAPAASRDPGATPPAPPAEVRLDVGLRVQSVPGPGQRPQIFETVEEVTARPEWNAIPARRDTPGPGLGPTHAWLRGADLGLRVGDALLLSGGDGAADPWAMRVLNSVDTRAAEGRTHVTWSGPVPAFPKDRPPVPYLLRARLRVFGHNAPLWRTMSDDFREKYAPGQKDSGDWPDSGLSPVDGSVDVDGAQPGIADGSWVVLVRLGAAERFRVSGTQEVSRAAYAVSGTVTRLGLPGVQNSKPKSADVRDTTVHAVAVRLDLAPGPDETAVTEDAVDVTADVSAMLPGRRLLVTGRTTGGATRTEAVTVRGVDPLPGGWRIRFAPGLTDDYLRESVVVYGNVVAATHGETVRQLLGGGDLGTAFQRFPLAHAPLTHVLSGDTAGTASTLEIRVDDVLWHEVPTLYGAGPDDRVHTVRRDETGVETVCFGDGVHGARLPTGRHNVRARYRTGLGTAGRLGADTLSQLLDRPLGVKGVTNPLPTEGGTDPEPVDTARRTIPLAVRTLGRAVSLLDYEDLALGITGVAKAHAATVILRAGRAVLVTVALDEPPGPGTGGRLRDIAAALRGCGDPQVRVEVVAYRPETFRLALRVAVEPDRAPDDVLTALGGALSAAYSFARRDLLAPVHRSEVIGAAHTVPGVLAVDVTALHTGTTPAVEDRLIPQQPRADAHENLVPAGLLVLDDTPIGLEVMP